MTALLEIAALTVSYRGVPAVCDLHLGVAPGRIASLLGPSGCGKSTILRAIAGFEAPAHGRVVIGGRTVSTPEVQLAPERRGVGMVFQDLALFPHLNVADNVAYGLRKWSRQERGARVASLLALVGLGDRGTHFPHQLSGGQRQRVALIRALAPRPALLLMDEPFSSLDRALREQLAVEVRAILKSEGTTAILVTHDQAEAFSVADEVGVLDAGVLHQWGDPWHLYHRPASRFVAEFIGNTAMLPGRLVRVDRAETPLGILPVTTLEPLTPGTDVDIAMRPQHVLLDAHGPFQAQVIERRFQGDRQLYRLAVAGGTCSLLCQAPAWERREPREQVRFRLLDSVFDCNCGQGALEPGREPPTAFPAEDGAVADRVHGRGSGGQQREARGRDRGADRGPADHVTGVVQPEHQP